MLGASPEHDEALTYLQAALSEAQAALRVLRAAHLQAAAVGALPCELLLPRLRTCRVGIWRWLGLHEARGYAPASAELAHAPIELVSSDPPDGSGERLTEAASIRCGLRFGELTVVGPGPLRNEAEPTIALTCDCGRPALRAVRYLRLLPAGTTPMCRVCLMEFNRGGAIHRRLCRQALWVDMWARTGNLYAADWVEREASALRTELELDEPTTEDAPPSIDVAMAEEPGVDPGHGRFIVPIESEAGWSCCRCAKPFGEGYGCVSCALVFCEDCAELHQEGVTGGLSLEEISLIYRLSRERIRQMIAKAVRKLRHPSRSRFLKEFWSESEPVGAPDPGDLSRLEKPPSFHCGRPVSIMLGSGIRYCSHCGKSFPLLTPLYDDDLSIEEDFTSACVARQVTDLLQRAGECRGFLLFRHGGSTLQRWRFVRRIATNYEADRAYLGLFRRISVGGLALWHNGLVYLNVTRKTRALLQPSDSADSALDREYRDANAREP